MNTPLHLAVIRGNIQISQLLIRSGADINAVDVNGDNVVHFAARLGHELLLGWLLSKGPNIWQKNFEGKIPEEVSQPQLIHCFQKYKKRTLSQTENHRKKPGKIEVKKVVINEMGENKAPGVITPNDFIPISELGRGSFGEVYLVSKQDTGQYYAMKVLKKEKVLTQSLIRYALTERKVLSFIKHPFIVSLKFAFQTSEKLFLVIDYCPGGDLRVHLTETKYFSEQRAKIYISEVLLALEELHKHNIIYRDLKPDNIVIDKDGHARLTDFGLSKEGIFDSCMANSFCGSLAYLAPEMIKRQGHGKAVDWYLLGVLFYEMVTGFPPYFSPDKNEILNNIQHGRLKMPSKLSPEAKELIRDVSFI